MSLETKIEKISRVKKIESFFQDRYHLLFKGAAENHLRIQNALKNPDGTYQLTIKFDSYTDLKKYQKKLRRMTVSLSGAMAMMIVAVIVAPYVMNPNKSAAANFIWIQNSWAGTAGATAATKSGWTGYASKDASITAGATVSLTQSTPSLTGDGTTDYGGLASTPPAGFFVDVSDANNKKLALKKVIGAACSAAGECVSGNCFGTCMLQCDANTVCGQKCAYNGSSYSTVSIGGLCWFAEDLRTTKKPDGVTAITTNGGSGSAPFGYYYTWAVAGNGAALTSSAGAKIQGICPNGWHIPSFVAAGDDFNVLNTAVGGNSGALRTTGTTYWTSPNSGATNSSGFSAIGNGGVTGGIPGFATPYDYGLYWSSALNGVYSNVWYIMYNSAGIYSIGRSGGDYFSVRCVKN